MRIRDLGYSPGVLPTGPTNGILDIDGLHISQTTVRTSPNLQPGSTATKGLTVICPRPPEVFSKPCRASTFCFNGNGELTGCRQIADWGFANTPIAITNTFSLGSVYDGMWDFVIEKQDDLGWDWLTRARDFGTPVVGETSDWLVNSDVKESRLSHEDIKKCFANLKCRQDGGAVQEGQYGGGAGMTCHQFTGGTGTSSRIVNASTGNDKGYTLAALCQSNYGLRQDLVIGGVPIGKILMKEDKQSSATQGDEAASSIPPGRPKDGSIIIVIVTDAPLTTNQLSRVARHATVGLSLVGSYGVGRNTSGDIFIALSTYEYGSENLVDARLAPAIERPAQTYAAESVKNEAIDPFFYACAEAVEEAILNSMVAAAGGTVGMDGTKIEGFPVAKVKELLERHLVKL